MKLNVKELKPNPFRNIGRYPIDRAKVESLKTSIDTTGFWDNILIRVKDGEYQIAYGHHRLIAIKELGLKTIEAPVRKLDDAMMLRIMAEENIEWNTNPAVVNETVLAVKRFLDGELAKYETWKQCRGTKSYLINLLGRNLSEGKFAGLKQRGAGQTTILKFLGGNWKQWMIQEALDTIKDKFIDREAVESLPTTAHARKFKKAVKDYKVPKVKQKEIAQKIVKDDIGKSDIARTVRRAIPDADEAENDPLCVRLERLVTDIDNQARALKNKITVLRGEMKTLNVKQLKGIKVSLAKSSLRQLWNELKRLEGKEK